MTSTYLPYQGRHLIADLHGCERLNDIGAIESLLRDAAHAAGASVLEIRLHSFGSGQGVTGVAILAESHISIHTWPEHSYAALDFFLCGARHDLDAALAIIVAVLRPRKVRQHDFARGYGKPE
jgi:S-adenosylmethionine decarboxylase